MRGWLGVSKWPKKYIAFFTIIPLLTITALIKIDCPVCRGEGYLSSTYGMENVKINSVWAQSRGTLHNACAMFVIYYYDVTLTATNEGLDEAMGWVKLVLVDFSKGNIVDTKYTLVEILGKTTLDITFKMCFQSPEADEPQKPDVKAEPVTEKITDKTCGGTGKVPLNAWPIVNGIKEEYKEIEQIQRPWAPNPYFEPPG